MSKKAKMTVSDFEATLDTIISTTVELTKYEYELDPNPDGLPIAKELITRPLRKNIDDAKNKLLDWVKSRAKF